MRFQQEPINPGSWFSGEKNSKTDSRSQIRILPFFWDNPKQNNKSKISRDRHKNSCADKGFISIGRSSTKKIVNRCYLIDYKHSCDVTCVFAVTVNEVND